MLRVAFCLPKLEQWNFSLSTNQQHSPLFFYCRRLISSRPNFIIKTPTLLLMTPFYFSTLTAAPQSPRTVREYVQSYRAMHHKLLPAANRSPTMKCHHVHLELPQLSNSKRSPSISAIAAFPPCKTQWMNPRQALLLSMTIPYALLPSSSSIYCFTAFYLGFSATDAFFFFNKVFSSLFSSNLARLQTLGYLNTWFG